MVLFTIFFLKGNDAYKTWRLQGKELKKGCVSTLKNGEVEGLLLLQGLVYLFNQEYH